MHWTTLAEAVGGLGDKGALTGSVAFSVPDSDDANEVLGKRNSSLTLKQADECCCVNS